MRPSTATSYGARPTVRADLGAGRDEDFAAVELVAYGFALRDVPAACRLCVSGEFPGSSSVRGAGICREEKRSSGPLARLANLRPHLRGRRELSTR